MARSGTGAARTENDFPRLWIRCLPLCINTVWAGDFSHLYTARGGVGEAGDFSHLYTARGRVGQAGGGGAGGEV